jgi:DNA-binding MarR family transcriptional regulator
VSDDRHAGETALLAALRHLAGDLVGAHQRQAEVLGLQSSDLRCLQLVAAERDATAGRLAELLGLTTGAVTGVLDRLEQRGLVERVRDAEDRRRVLVRLRESGGDDLAIVLDPLAAAVGELTRTLNGTTIAALTLSLERLGPLLREETDRLSARHPAPAGGERRALTVPRAGLREARLLLTGVNNVQVLARPLGDDLCAADISGKGTVELRELDGTVTLGAQRGLFGGWIGPGTVTIAAGVAWTVVVDGGAARFEADLAGVVLRALAIRHGGSRMDLRLPRPEGRVAVEIGGGLSRMRLRRPPGTALRLHIKGGATRLDVDAFHFGAVGGGLRWQTSDFDEVPDGYDVSVGGGADRLEIVEG